MPTSLGNINIYKVSVGDLYNISKISIGEQVVYSAGNIVTYIVDENTIYQEEVDEGESCLSPTSFDIPSKSGYVFAGWSETPNGDILIRKTMDGNPITLYAKYVSMSAVTFNYTGSVQKYIIPITGLYLLTAFGAGGGGGVSRISKPYRRCGGGTGGKSTLYRPLTAGDELYIVCGGRGSTGSPGSAYSNLGGYNGGGNSAHDGYLDQCSGSGGGATHIATVSGLLSNISPSNVLIVAGGGGGGGNAEGSSGGNGGGGRSAASGNGAYGKGGNNAGYFAAGGGGGFYGGGGGVTQGSGGQGGSGYIPSSVTNYGGITYTNTNIVGSGSIGGLSGLSDYAAPDREAGHGYASIQLIST